MTSTEAGDTDPAVRRDRLAGEAAHWVLRTENGVADSRTREEFSEWLLRSPLHVEEYLAAVSTWEALSLLRFDQGSVDALIAAAKRAPDEFGKVITLGSKRPHLPSRLMRPQASEIGDPARRRWVLAAASLATLGLGAGAGVLFGHRHRRQTGPLIFQTVVGEQRRVILADQSMMLLDTNTEVRLHWLAGERHVDLLRGQVHLEVTPDATRPFTVMTREASVRVLGTTFDVRADATVTRVAVVEGLVDVTQAPNPSGRHTHGLGSDSTTPTPVQLRAGDRVAVTADRMEVNTGPPVSVMIAWTQQRLIFRDQSLASVVSEFNRYQVAPLVIADARLAKVQISGVFDIRDPGSLLEYLQIFERATIHHSPDGTVYISASSHSSE